MSKEAQFVAALTGFNFGSFTELSEKMGEAVTGVIVEDGLIKIQTESSVYIHVKASLKFKRTKVVHINGFNFAQI